MIQLITDILPIALETGRYKRIRDPVTKTFRSLRVEERLHGLCDTDRQIFFSDRKKVNPDLFVIEIEICTCIYNIVICVTFLKQKTKFTFYLYVPYMTLLEQRFFKL